MRFKGFNATQNPLPFETYWLKMLKIWRAQKRRKSLFHDHRNCCIFVRPIWILTWVLFRTDLNCYQSIRYNIPRCLKHQDYIPFVADEKENEHRWKDTDRGKRKYSQVYFIHLSNNDFVNTCHRKHMKYLCIHFVTNLCARIDTTVVRADKEIGGSVWRHKTYLV
jgi:hypothetical protein